LEWSQTTSKLTDYVCYELLQGDLKHLTRVEINKERCTFDVIKSLANGSPQAVNLVLMVAVDSHKPLINVTVKILPYFNFLIF